jgi:hypothetical protein
MIFTVGFCIGIGIGIGIGMEKSYLVSLILRLQSDANGVTA